ncbi:multiple inositol polyphosphate phosphatase 1 [Lingula anatina]|uniref:Multiple inositol polyphosphate phosphatase 1 n=1 Tax=Lingula anatina TaxID=7574 RepID=A0A1S3J706_LINAN|nr:multiple inositol polyphosphate phosphatase 1 [Lingula anatina]|eukprot:XP_013406197.1 multiple inositol polyphosphate phosphatase 1 [Lingula anatina]
MSAPVECKLFTLVLLILIFILASELSNCKTNESDAMKYVCFSSKTAYENLLKYRRTANIKDGFVFPPRPMKCQPIQLNVVLRHGTRHPSVKDIQKMQACTTKVVGNVINADFVHLNNWKSSFPLSHEKQLVDVGRREHEDLAVKYSTAFPELISDFSRVKIVSSRISRSLESAQSFINKIAGVGETPKININDHIMRFFEYCQNYLDRVDHNKSANSEMKKFKNGPEMKQLATSLGEKLSLQNNIQLNGDDLMGLFRICAYEVAFYGFSHWCDVLNLEDLHVLDYLDDLKQYWKKSYGYVVNYAQSCPLLADIIHTLDSAADSKEGHPKAVFQFGHAETIFPLFCLLGLFKDEVPLRADNFRVHRNRKFRSSVISPFAGNIAFVLYHCDKEGMTSEENRRDGWPEDIQNLMVQVYVNEKLVQLPFCGHKMCSYEEFKKNYKQYATNCDYNGVCKRKTPEKKDEL